MTALCRAFVAVVPPDDVLDAVDAVIAPIRREHATLRWSSRASWHVTLAFLGTVPDEEVLLGHLRPGVAEQEGFGVELGGSGAFPSTRRATTLWLGLDHDAGLLRLAAHVRSVSGALDDRPFRPHLTIARVSRERDVRAVARALDRGPVGRRWRVGEVVLFESELAPSGAVHRVRARIDLG